MRTPAPVSGAAGPDRSTVPVTPERLRQFTAAVLVLLTLLWGYATFLTARDALDLLALRTLTDRLGRPTETLLSDLRAERRLSVVELATPGRYRTALTEQRARTDGAVRALRRFVRDDGLRALTAGPARDRAAELVRRLAALPPLRADIDGGRADRTAVAAAYAEIIDAGFAVYDARWTSRHPELTEPIGPFVALARSIELLAREDALVAGALAAKRLTRAEYDALAELVAVQRFARAEAASGLPPVERAGYAELAAGPALTRLRVVEEQLLRAGPTGSAPGAAPPPLTADEWGTAVEPALAALHGLVTTGVTRSVDGVAPGAAGIVLRLGLVGGLGLVAVVGTVVLAVRAARRIVADPHRLRTEPAIPRTARDELAERVATPAERAANLARAARVATPGRGLATRRERTAAVQAAHRQPQTGRATEQAADRATERAAHLAARLAAHQRAHEVFVRLTRENQSLLHQQIGLLDTLERRETDTAALAELFHLDHLATRIRRNVEQLISFSGGTPGRRWRRPVPLVDIVRGAVAEVSDYGRVLVAPDWSGQVSGRALPDLIHLLAEVIETALAGSPPTTTVRVSGELRGDAQAILVSDDGVGREPAELAVANALLQGTPADPPLHDRTGLYLLGRLARRHGVTVELAAGPRGGTTATVVVPAALLIRPVGGGTSDSPIVGSGLVDRPEENGPTATPVDTTVDRTGDPARPSGGPAALPVRVRRPHQGPPAGAPNRAAGPHQNGAPVRPAASDWSTTIELPVTLPTPSATAPTRSTERTTGDSRSSHDGHLG